MSKLITFNVKSFTPLSEVIKKINENIADENINGIFLNKKSLFNNEIEIYISEKYQQRFIEVPVNQAKGSGKSKYRGVYWDKKNKKWRSCFTDKGKRYALGRYKCEIEAAKAYDKKAFEILGTNAYLNFIGVD